MGAALAPGHRLLSIAAELAAMTDASGTAGIAGRLFPPKEIVPGWVGEVGVLGDPAGSRGKPGGAFLLWLGIPAEAEGRQAGASKAVPPKPGLDFGQLVLYPPSGRYRIEYWDTSDCHLAGVEIGTATPLVLGPPDCGAPLVLLIVSLLSLTKP